jgi:DNA uptake protein ComE-like DNA-binding protein
MRLTSWSGNHHGYVLVIVMGLLAALSVMALSLGAAARTDLAQTRRFQDETAAELLSRAGIEWAVHYLNTVERQGTLWQAPWYVQSAMFQARPLGPGTFDVRYSDPSGALHYGLQDEEARVNLNTAPATLLAALPGVGQELAGAIVQQRQQQPWSTPEEVLQRGLVAASVWYGRAGQPGLSAYLTVWGSGKININTASPVILAALPGITPAMVEAIMRYRQGDDRQLGTADDRYFRTVTDLLSIAEIDRSALQRFGDLLTVTPSAFRCIASGRVMSGAGQARLHQRLAVLERSANATSLRYWRRLD